MMRILILAFLTFFATASADDAIPDGAPGQVRFDEDGNAQMWGGPPLEEIADTVRLQIVLAESTAKPVLLFKHSTQCPISARAAARVAEYVEELGEDAPTVYWVKVIESRPVSNQIESRLNVKHESPQIILIEAAAAVWDASHDAITADAIEQALDETKSPTTNP